MFYLTGKLQRNGVAFRAFTYAKSVAGQPETKIDRKFNIKTLGEEKAWAKACAYITEGINVDCKN